MLQSFRFANHQSFRDEQQLNLMAAFPADHPSLSPREPVSIAGIFGPNASGKSNALAALNFFSYLIRASDREVEPGLGLRREPFRLVREVAAQPSRYVADLLLNDEHVTYGVTLNDERILEEWLTRYVRSDRYSQRGREAVVFERNGDDYTWGSDYSTRDDLRLIADITAPTALFLTSAARARVRRTRDEAHGKDLPDQLHRVYSWFRRLGGQGPASLSRDLRYATRTVALALEDPRRRQRLINLVGAADFGIEDVSVEPEIYSDGLFEDPEAGRRSMGRPPRLLFRHRGADSGVLLDHTDESRGTIQLLRLGVSAMTVLDHGGLLTVDEIDSSLHPLLTARFINLFRSPTTNPHRAQLLFTSHDATLLGHLDGDPIVLRDEIWFTEKDHQGVSSLYSLAEFKPRKEGENWERRYMNGAYGAVPELSIDLFELALRARGDFDGEAV